MTKLTDTQLVILSAACGREGRRVLPLPEKLKGGAAAKVVDSLLAKGLVLEAEAERDDPIWRETGDERLTLIATDAAFEALGIEREGAPADEPATDAGAPAGDAPPLADPAAQGGDGVPAGTESAAAPEPPEAAQGATVGRDAAPQERPRKMRADSKQAQLIAMLKRPHGATVAEIADAFGWQHHTVRGAIAGALKKKLGLDVASEKVEGRGRVYRIAE